MKNHKILYAYYKVMIKITCDYCDCEAPLKKLKEILSHN